MSRRGVFVPLITPLDESGAVCPTSVARLMHRSRTTASGYIPCLTSGEGWRLSPAQWEAMVRSTLENAEARAVIVGIERPTTDEVLEYVKEAQELGARAIMLTSPFGADVDQPQILEHYRRLHDACDLDIYVYNESALSGNETAFATLLAIAELPRVVGIKDSITDAREAGEIHELQNRGLAYYVGWEQHLARGGPSDGNVVSLANLEPSLCRLAHVSTDPAVRAEITRLVEVHALLSEDWYRHVKRALAGCGVIVSDRTVID
jgi:4-hydroxy-tetrahydrodipicolinate synthase